MTWRPALHFATEDRWINDPNGLVAVGGEYHLCYQLNPHGNGWGNMSWGHAVSDDLLTWRQLEPALTPYPGRAVGASTLIFSGSAIGAEDGASLLAFFTAHERDGDTPLNESVARAISTDGGRTWHRQPGTPVLDRQRRDFRDPKVIRLAGGALAMAIAVPDERRVEFYRSDDDGIGWIATGAFAAPAWVSERDWECPDLVRVPVRGTDECRWVLLVSAGHPAGDGYSGMVYWVGEFDGAAFVADDAQPRWMDHGKDFFAGVTYNGLDAPGQAPVLIGWASNWRYASVLPGLPWRGMLSLPRELELVHDAGGLVLAQRPCAPFEALCREPVAAPTSAPLDVQLRVPASATCAGIVLRNEAGAQVRIGVEPAVGELWCDRSGADLFGVGEVFATCERAPLPEGRSVGGDGDAVEVRVLFDACLVEVFAAGGRTVLTELAFVPGPVTVEAFGGADVQVSAVGRRAAATG